MLSQICPLGGFLALGLGPQGGGKTPAPLTRHSRATHIFSAPLTRHSRATHAPLTFALRAVAFLFFHIKHLPFCGYSHFPFWGFTVAAVFREKRPSCHWPATRATGASNHRPCHSPAAPRHSRATRTTHPPPTPHHGMVLRWSSDGSAEKGWQSRFGKGGRFPRRSPGKRNDFLREFFCGKAFFFLTPVGPRDPFGSSREGLPRGPQEGLNTV